MKVLHLVKTAVGGEWARRQMQELVNMGVEVHVAVPDDPMVSRYREAGVMVHLYQFDFPLRSPWKLAARCQQLKKLVEEIKPDIIHSHFVGTTITMRLALGKHHHIPRIFQVPGPLHLENLVTRHAELFFAGSSDFWVGSCKLTCEIYKNTGIPEDHIFLSYYSPSLEHFSDQRPGKLRKELQLDRDTRIVGMVAYMYPPKTLLGQKRGIKGHEDLIDAIAICRKTNLNVIGVLVGGAYNNATSYEQRIRSYAEARCEGGIVFLGSRDDVSELYPDFDVAVHPSHSENLGGAPESLLHGIPTIATNIGGFPDVVIPEQTGWLVPAKQPVALAKAIQEVLEDPTKAKVYAHSGRNLVKELFDLRRTVKEIRSIYSLILKGTRLG